LQKKVPCSPLNRVDPVTPFEFSSYSYFADPECQILFWVFEKKISVQPSLFFFRGRLAMLS
jgi:hypothetical protein